jgi:PAS domain S-box-containing protein
MKNHSRKTETSPLRQKAEERVKKRLSKPGSQLSKNEALKRLHELEAYQAEELLQKSEKRFRNYIESSGDIMYVVDNDLKFLYGNQKYLERRGLTIEELLAKEYRDYHSDEGTKKFMERVKAVQTLKKPVVYEYQSEIDGRYFLRTLSPMIDSETMEIESLTVISRDITERKKAEKELYESRQMLQTVLDTIPAGVFWKDRNFIYLGGNRAWLDAAGLKSAEEVIGKSDYGLPWDKEQVDSFREYDKRVMESGIPEFDIIEPFTRAGGTLSWARTNKVPLRDSQGSIIGILGTYEDVTKIKQADEALRMSEEKYRNLFNNSEVGMFRTRFDGSEILEFNKKYLEILGYTSEELEGIPSVSLWVNKNEREKVVQKLKAEGRMTELEFELLNKQGDVINCIGSARLYPDTGIVEGSILDITERKMAEEELNVAIAKYKTLFECFPLGITVSDDAGKIVESNPKAEKLLGMPGSVHRQRDIDSKDWHIIHPDGTPMPSDEYASVRALKDKRIVENVEMGIVKPDDTITWINVTAAPLPLQGHGVVITYQDITQHKLAVDALRSSEEKYRLLVENMGEGVGINNGDEKFLFANPSAEEIFGVGPGELIGTSLQRFLSPENFQLVRKQTSQRQKGIYSTYELEIISSNGESKYIMVTGTPYFNKNDEFLGTFAIFRDITERKQMEQALNESMIRYRGLFDNINSGVAVYEVIDDGRDFIFKDFNRAGERIDNDKRERLIGKSIFEVRPGITDFGLVEVFRRVWLTGKPESLPIKIYKDDHISAWYENFIYKLPSGEIVAVFDDVSKQKQAEDDLTKAHEMLKKLYIYQDDAKENERKVISREIHDELGQLLSALKIDLSWTKANYKNREEVIKKIDSMTDIVSGTIKTVQRISSDLRPGLLDDLGLIPAIEWFCQEFENRTGIKCHLILGDFESSSEKKNLALYRILQEATTNVMRHANARNVYVKCVQEEDSIFLEIIDDGTGMKQTKIDSSKSLGLIGMRERVKQFDGILDIKSTINSGTKLSVYIPID